MDSYLLAKTLHIIAFTCWMAGMFYLPRLFVYHAQAKAGSEASETFKVMEHKLLRFIMNPAMIVTWVAGIWLVVITGHGAPGSGGWIHAKIALVLLLSGTHGMMAGMTKRFARDANTKTERYYRIFNEVPTLLFIGIVVMAVFKPF